jgi:hypothetical protein
MIHITSSAPYNDLLAIQQMRDLKCLREEEAVAYLESWERHLDYLSPPLVMFCLADDHLPNNEKSKVADALLAVLTDHDVKGFKPDGRVPRRAGSSSSTWTCWTLTR